MERRRGPRARGALLGATVLVGAALGLAGGATAGDRVIDLSMDFGTQQVTLTDSLGEATTSPLTLGELGPPAD